MEQKRKAKREQWEEVVSQSYSAREQGLPGGEDDKVTTFKSQERYADRKRALAGTEGVPTNSRHVLSE